VARGGACGYTPQLAHNVNALQQLRLGQRIGLDAPHVVRRRRLDDAQQLRELTPGMREFKRAYGSENTSRAPLRLCLLPGSHPTNNRNNDSSTTQRCGVDARREQRQARPGACD
jgi:hypothetical protein